ncbi:MAG: DUF2723 domain-containing protein [bacterium]|nr:DUF2723 domain-containing protein [bacterium]
MTAPEPRPRWELPLLAFGLPFLVYTLTRAHVWALDTLYTIDSAEMVIAAHTLGIDHPPGHPLYLLFAHLFSQLPFALPDGGVIFTSAVFGALAALFLSLALYERTRDIPVSLATGWSMAFGFVFWIHATIAEVYTVQLCFLGLFLYLAARWLRTRSTRTLHLLSFCLGLGASTNILLFILVVPATVFLLLQKNKKDHLLSFFGWGILGLTPLLYIPLRLLQGSGFITDFVYLNGFEPLSLRWFWWYLSAEEFTGSKILDTPLIQYPGLILSYIQSYTANLTPASSILATASIALITVTKITALRLNRSTQNPSRRRRAPNPTAGFLHRFSGRAETSESAFDTLLILVFVCTALPVLAYNVADREVFFMPSFYLLTAFAGLGLHQVHTTVRARVPKFLNRTVGVLIAFALPSVLLVQHTPQIVSITSNETAYEQRLARFNNLPPNTLIVAPDDGHATRYKYFQLVQNLRQDVTILTLGRLAPRATSGGSLKPGLNQADRLRALHLLFEQHPNRPIFAVLDDRMPPEFTHFRTIRSEVDPYLLRLEPKPPALQTPNPPSIQVHTEGSSYSEIEFIGFEIRGLDRGASRTFESSMLFHGQQIRGIIKRSELFELSFVVQRIATHGGPFFAEFAFVNDRMEIPTVREFTAARQVEVLPEDLQTGWYQKDAFTFKIPGFVPGGFYTLAVRVNKASSEPRGSYQGKPIRTLVPLQTQNPWAGQSTYFPLGRIWVE